MSIFALVVPFITGTPKQEVKDSAVQSTQIEVVKAEVVPVAPTLAEPEVIPTDPEDYAHYKVKKTWGEDQWNSFNELVNHEAGFDGVKKVNPTSGAYGIPQCLPVSKCVAEYPDFKTNHISQIDWMIDYVSQRYGNPNDAWYFWQYIAPTKSKAHSNWY